MSDDPGAGTSTEQWLHELGNALAAISLAAMASARLLRAEPERVEGHLREIAARCARCGDLLAAPPFDSDRENGERASARHAQRSEDAPT